MIISYVGRFTTIFFFFLFMDSNGSYQMAHLHETENMCIPVGSCFLCGIGYTRINGQINMFICMELEYKGYHCQICSVLL